MGYYNVLGHYVPDKDETYEYTNVLGHKIKSTPESRGYVKSPTTGKYISKREYQHYYGNEEDDLW